MLPIHPHITAGGVMSLQENHLASATALSPRSDAVALWPLSKLLKCIDHLKKISSELWVTPQGITKWIFYTTHLQIYCE